MKERERGDGDVTVGRATKSDRGAASQRIPRSCRATMTTSYPLLSLPDTFSTWPSRKREVRRINYRL